MVTNDGLDRELLFSDPVADVRFGSKGDKAACPLHVWFTPDNGHASHGSER
jgi:hypothetical protein